MGRTGARACARSAPQGIRFPPNTPQVNGVGVRMSRDELRPTEVGTGAVQFSRSLGVPLLSLPHIHNSRIIAPLPEFRKSARFPCFEYCATRYGSRMLPVSGSGHEGRATNKYGQPPGGNPSDWPDGKGE